MNVPCETLPHHLRGRTYWYFACTRLSDPARKRSIFVCKSKDEAKGLARGLGDYDPATAHIGWISKGAGLEAITTSRPIHLSDPHGLLYRGDRV